MITGAPYVGSADFYNTLFSVVFGVLAGCIGAWATFSSTSPKRRIHWVQQSNLSLIPFASMGTPAAMTIRHAASPSVLAEARVVELEIRNAGRRDVQPEDFSLGDDSLVFDFGVPVITVLEIFAKPSHAPKPDTVLSGTLVKIKKSPINRNQSLQFVVLVNGPRREPELKSASILNTPIKEISVKQKAESWKRDAVTIVGVVVMVISSVMLYFDYLDQRDRVEHLNNCRYWDAHDVERSKEKCPQIREPN